MEIIGSVGHKTKKQDVESESSISVPVTISKVIYKSPTSDFAIIACDIVKDSPYYKDFLMEYPGDWVRKKEVVVKTFTYSTLGDAEYTGQQIVFSGEIVTDGKYGQQLQAHYHFSDIPSDRKGMVSYLDSLPNIGVDRANKLIDKFGVHGIEDVLENAPHKLLDLKMGFTPEKIESIVKRWMEDRVSRKIHLWFGDRGLSSNLISKIITKWKNESIDKIEANPYVLMEIRGIAFKKADEIAYKVKGENISVYARTKACMTYLMEDSIGREGHVYLPFNEMEAGALELLKEGKWKIPDDDYRKAMKDVLKGEPSLFTMVKDTTSGVLCIYSTEVYEQEVNVAKMISNLAKVKSELKIADDSIDRAHKDLSELYQKPIKLDSNQQAAVLSVFKNKITVLTGGGGSGKSTIARCICKIAEWNNYTVKLMTPTGKAARVLSEKTGLHAGTIHRSLGMVAGSVLPTNYIENDILIVDETSMCGIDTAYAVMCAVEQNSGIHIVFIGDHQQLPSVSPGNVLFDIIKSECSNVIKLQQIYRQSENSFITYVADKIAKGEPTVIPAIADDIFFREKDTPDIPGFIQDMASSYVKKSFSMSDLQILAPMYKGNAGVININKVVQGVMAKEQGITDHIAYGGGLFYLGDKVMQMTNDYTNNVFNGDIGFVSDVGKKVVDPEKSDELSTFVDVDFGENTVTYAGEDIGNLSLAWCITVHKFQGSQCKNVVFVVAREHFIMMNRELVYTGITRASKKMILVGDSSMLKIAAGKSVAKKRYTNLATMIRDQMTGTTSLVEYNIAG